MEKKCSQCGEVKPLDQFTKDSRNKSGYRAYCKACACEYMKGYYSQTARGRFNILRDAASSQGRPFNIDPDAFVKWWDSQPKQCYYCKRLLTIGKNREHKLTDRTIDRKDNSLGYTLNNIALACRRCNLMKGEWLTEQQTLEIAEKYFVL